MLSFISVLLGLAGSLTYIYPYGCHIPQSKPLHIYPSYVSGSLGGTKTCLYTSMSLNPRLKCMLMSCFVNTLVSLQDILPPLPDVLVVALSFFWLSIYIYLSLSSYFSHWFCFVLMPNLCSHLGGTQRLSRLSIQYKKNTKSALEENVVKITYSF